MAKFRVTSPEGKVYEVNAPDGATQADAVAYVQKQQGARVSKPPGVADDIFGALTTLNRSLPGADELADAITAGAGTIRDLVAGDSPAGRDVGALLKGNWEGARRQSGNASANFVERRPVAGNLTKGVGLAVQAAPAMLTGGATAAPQIASATKGLVPVATRVAKALAPAAAKGAVAAGLGAQVSGLTGEGSLEDRVRAGNEATLPAMAVGAALPIGLSATDRARRAIADAAQSAGTGASRIVNKVAGGTLLDPTQEAAKRLGETLQADGLSETAVRQALEEWQTAGGPSPAFMDLVTRNGGGQKTMALIRGSALTGGGRNVASKYGNQVAVDLQDEAIARTRQLTPDERSIPDLEAEVAGRIERNSTAPTATPGRGGALVSARLNSEFDRGKVGVDQAYDAVRNSDALVTAPTLTDLPGRIRASLDQELITPEIMGSLNPGTRAILSEIDKLAGQAGRLERAAAPSVGESLQSGIPTGGVGAAPTFRIAEIERVRKAINARTQTAQGEDLVALRVAKREFDSWLNDAVDNGLIEGDVAGVDLLRNARKLHAKQREAFGGGDLIEQLTEREFRGGGRANSVAPDDASNVILGRNGVSNRQDVTRDLTRLRDRLGVDSDEWRALQDEAVTRFLGRDAGGENYGRAWTQFADQNPDLARLLMRPEDQAALSRAQSGIRDAVADRGAVSAGQGVINTPSARFAANVGAVGDRTPLAQVGAARALEDGIERPTEGATGVLNRIATATRSKRNLGEVFGDEADRYRQAIGQMVDQVKNARFIDPNTGSQSAGRLADEALVEGTIPTSKTAIITTILNKIKQGVSLTDAEREAIVDLATRKIDGPEAINVVRMPQKSLPLTPQQRAQIAIAAAQAQGAQQARSGR